MHQMSSSKLLIFPFDAKFTFDMDNFAEPLFPKRLIRRFKSEFALQNYPRYPKENFKTENFKFLNVAAKQSINSRYELYFGHLIGDCNLNIWNDCESFLRMFFRRGWFQSHQK